MSGVADLSSSSQLFSSRDPDSLGDFVYVPAYEVHIEENASTDEPLVVLLSRNCPGPVVHYVGDGDAGAPDTS